MRIAFIVLVMALAGCASVPWASQPQVSEAECTASCNAHYEQCPKVFAGFPERGAIECPAEHNNCLKVCANGRSAAPRFTMPPAGPRDAATAGPGLVPETSTKETKLRELKQLHDKGLVTDDVYRDLQKAILSGH